MRGRRDSDDPSNEDLLGLGGDAGELREQDRFLPIANVARIMKRGIPTEQVCIAYMQIGKSDFSKMCRRMCRPFFRILCQILQNVLKRRS